jgi:geranylgeranyl diphosphate synthase type II
MSVTDELLTFQTEIKNKVDIKIGEYLNNQDPLLEGLLKSIQYSVLGGKRVRALFMFLVGDLFEVPGQQLLSSACAIEMIHASSLIMDDLPYMDNAELRRGKPANHIIFGQDVALCASIGLLSKAVEIIYSDEYLSEHEKNTVVTILNRSYGVNGLAGGQFVDLKLKWKHVEMKVLEFINQRKTAALFSAAGEIGARLGRAEESELKYITDFANHLGFTFQIIDDILDLKGNEKIVGKDLNKDKMNFAKLVGLSKAESLAKQYMEKAEDSLMNFQDRSKNLIAFGKYLLQRAS